ncbi:MAG: hypothetical protein ACI32A_06280, partial [Floccifex sp.]
MNKKIIASSLLVFSLCGCSGANASIQNGNETIMTIGSTKYTRDDEYQLIKLANGGSLTLQLAKNAVYDQVVGLNDEIKEKA